MVLNRFLDTIENDDQDFMVIMKVTKNMMNGVYEQLKLIFQTYEEKLANLKSVQLLDINIGFGVKKSLEIIHAVMKKSKKLTKNLR